MNKEWFIYTVLSSTYSGSVADSVQVLGPFDSRRHADRVAHDIELVRVRHSKASTLVYSNTDAQEEPIVEKNLD